MLTDASIVGKKAAQANRREMRAVLKELRGLVEESVALERRYEANLTALATLEEDYAKQVSEINSRYDKLEDQAKSNIKAIEDYWATVIPGLEKALADATATFDKENGILQGLIGERDNFLKQITDGARSFVNNLSFSLRGAAGGISGSKRIISREIRELANGIRVTFEKESIGDVLTGEDIRSQLQDRLQQVRDFATNIRRLTERGLDPELVKQFVAAGVSGAGDAAAALVDASDADLRAINTVQGELASSLADFASYVSSEWFELGITQQAAVVEPLRMAQYGAQEALRLANEARAEELRAAQAHLDGLTALRESELKKAKDDYDKEKDRIEKENQQILARQDQIAQELQNLMARLNRELAKELQQVGNRFAQGILEGFKKDYPQLYRELNKLMDDLAKSMARTTTLTVKIVYEESGKSGGDGGKEQPPPKGKKNVVSTGMVPLALGAPPPMNIATRSAGVGNVNITVNAGMGADGAEVGRQVVDALRQYERRNGPIPVSVAG